MAASRQKTTFKLIYILLAWLLILIPFVLLFNDLLTRGFESLALYRGMQRFLVPLEAKIVGAILIPLGYDYVAYLDGMKVNGVNIGLTWNCLGWQSLLLFTITAIAGLSGNYTLISKIQALLIGLLSLFLVNVFRLTVTTVLAVWYRPLFVILFHDYLVAFLTVIWLLAFWWFAYAWVLEEKVGG
jgi:exosortase/archaeosortase family protein